MYTNILKNKLETSLSKIGIDINNHKFFILTLPYQIVHST